MTRSLLASIAAVTLGAALFAAVFAGAPIGSAAGAKGGTLRANISGTDVQSVDPAIDYELFGWQIEFATCLKLLNYPDRSGARGSTLIPEAAASMPTVSRDGRTYTFHIRRGLRFNTGEVVSAETFAHAFDRVLNPKMVSPGAAFLGDVMGANAVLKGKAKRAVGIRASGNTLQIKLIRPLADLLARVAMPFFCAVPRAYPIDPHLNEPPASAGPYYVAVYIRNRTIVLKRNPLYRGSRPHHLDEIAITVKGDLQQSLLQVRSGEADYDLAGVPPTAPAELARRYGVNRSRYFVHSTNSVDYIGFNLSRPFFADAALRRAVNFALDRPALIRQIGFNGAVPTDQILPPTMPGFRDVRIYPLRGPDVAEAKKLAAGRGGEATLYITTDDPSAANQAQVIVANLSPLGIHVRTRELAFPALLGALRDPREPWDMFLLGWSADYPDPYDFIDINLNSRNVAPAGANYTRMRIPEFDRRMNAAARLTGRARYAAYAKLDEDIMRRVAPWAPIGSRAKREFVSERVGCFVFQEALGAMDLGAACLK